MVEVKLFRHEYTEEYSFNGVTIMPFVQFAKKAVSEFKMAFGKWGIYVNKTIKGLDTGGQDTPLLVLKTGRGGLPFIPPPSTFKKNGTEDLGLQKLMIRQFIHAHYRKHKSVQY